MLVFTPYRVTQSLVEAAADDVVVLHCLPAHRGQEIDGGRDRRASVGRVGSGREPPAHPEGTAAAPLRRGLRHERASLQRPGRTGPAGVRRPPVDRRRRPVQAEGLREGGPGGGGLCRRPRRPSTRRAYSRSRGWASRSRRRSTSSCGPGSFEELDALRAQVPDGVRAMTAIPGFGPKKAMMVYRELGIDSVDGLVAAAEDGRLAAMKGFSRATERNVVEAVRRLRASERPRAGRTRRSRSRRTCSTGCVRSPVSGGQRTPGRCGAWRRRSAMSICSWRAIAPSR